MTYDTSPEPLTAEITPKPDVLGSAELSPAPAEQATSLDGAPLKAVANGQPTKFKGGGQLGNQNATRHGLRGSKFPKSARSDERAVTQYIRAVREQWEADNGRPMAFGEEATLHRLRRSMTRDRLAGRWLRQPDLKTSERMQLVDAMEAAAARIEELLEKLGFSVRPIDPWFVPASPAKELPPYGTDGQQQDPEPPDDSTDAQTAQGPPDAAEKLTDDEGETVIWI